MQQTVDYIKATKNCYWVGMGDYCEFINRNDKRFDPGSLAEWIGVQEYGDIARAQITHLLKTLEPIAHKCLGLACGNHEAAIHKYTERDVYSDIVSGIKAAGKFPDDHKLAIGYYGWLILKFSGSARGNGKKDIGNTRTFIFNIHHGFTAGMLKGAKALSMERWLWTHNSDVVIFGHSHNTDIFTSAVQYCDGQGNVHEQMRRGCYGGTFLKTNAAETTTYSEAKGYLPLPMNGVEIVLRPRAAEREDAIRIAA